MLAIAVEKSANPKTGEVSVTHASQSTCPTSCPLLGKGCYAELGNARFTTGRLNRATGSRLDAAKQEAKLIDGLSGRRPLRIHVVGDAPTNRNAKILSDAAGRFTAKHDQPVWTYTHAWRNVNRQSWQGVSTLASCESIPHTKQAMERGYAAAVILPEFATDKTTLMDGVNVIPCPEQTGKAETCVECRLCMKDTWLRESNTVIGFAAHGMRASTVKQLLNVLN